MPQILVVGGGPAGAHLASLLATAGKDVLLLSDEAPQKPFFETLSARAIRDDLPVAEKCAGAISLWGTNSPMERPGLCSPWGNDVFVARPALEHHLRKRARVAGASEERDRVVSVARENLGWRVGCASGNTRRAALLIDATGRSSSVARRIGSSRRPVDRLIAIPYSLEANVRFELFHSIVCGAENGWWYVGPALTGGALALYYTDSDMLGSVPAPNDTNALEFLTEELALPSLTIESRGRPFPASTARLAPFVGEGWYAVGDAVTSFDPLSSFGLTFAILSAELVAESIIQKRCSRYYRAQVAELVFEFGLTHSDVYSREGRWADRPFWSRRRKQMIQ